MISSIGGLQRISLALVLIVWLPFGFAKPDRFLNLSQAIEALASPDLKTRRLGIESIAKSRSGSNDVLLTVRAFVRHTQDSESLLFALDYFVTLKDKAADAIPELVSLVQDPDPNVSGKAIQMLADLRVDHVDATRRLLAMLDGNQLSRLRIRWRIPGTIWSMTSGNDRGVKLIEQCLRNQDIGVQVSAAVLLLPSAKDSKPLLDIFQQAARSEFISLRHHLAERLASLYCAGIDAIPVLRRLCADPDSRVRQAAFTAVLNIAPAEEKVADVIRLGLKDSDPHIRLILVQSRRTCLLGMRIDLSVIIPLANDPDPLVRLESLLTLAVLADSAPERQKWGGQVTWLLFSENEFARSKAVGVVREIGKPELITFVALGITATVDPVETVRVKARQLIWDTTIGQWLTMH